MTENGFWTEAYQKVLDFEARPDSDFSEHGDCLTMDEFSNMVDEHTGLMSKVVYIKKWYIAIDTCKAGEYVIELDRCNTIPKIFEWTQHLLEKGWASSNVVLAFIDLAAERHGLKTRMCC